jgi:hypothetical protein
MTFYKRSRGQVRVLAGFAALALVVCTAAGAAVASEPVGVDDFVTTTVGTPVSFNPLVNDSDLDGDTLRMTALGSFTGADPLLLSLSSDGFTGETVFEPRAPYTGVFGFQYVVADESGGIDKARVQVSVRATDVPTVNGQGAFGVETGHRTSFEFNAGPSGSGLAGSLSLRRWSGQNAAFVSDSIDSLTGSGPNATMTGTGTLNGTSGYTFSVQLVEKGEPGGYKGDRIGVEIRDSGGTIVYTTNGTTAISGGNVQVL